jgi:hypothetical protein
MAMPVRFRAGPVEAGGQADGSIMHLSAHDARRHRGVGGGAGTSARSRAAKRRLSSH